MRIKTSVVIVFLALASCDRLARPAEQASAPVPDQVPVGRYTIVHSPQVERDTMLLDSVTGNTWQLVKLGKTDNSGMGWEFVAKIDEPPASASPVAPTIHTTGGSN